MSPDTYTFAAHPRHIPCTTFKTRLALHGRRPCALHRARAQFCSQSVLDSHTVGQGVEVRPSRVEVCDFLRLFYLTGQLRSVIEVEPVRLLPEPCAAACLLPACSTLSHRPLFRNVPRRAGRRDHQHLQDYRGHRGGRLRASRRHPGRLSVDHFAARSSMAVLVALACRLVAGLAVRRPSARRGRTQAARAAKRSA